MKKQAKKEDKVKIDKTMRDYGKEEFFVKKGEKAREILKNTESPRNSLTPIKSNQAFNENNNN